MAKNQSAKQSERETFREEIRKEVLDEIANKPPETEEELVELYGVCGHINRHSFGVDGEPDNLACERPKAHLGNHGADQLQRSRNLGEALSPSMTASFKPVLHKETGERLYYEGKIWSEWGDLAGTPADEIVPMKPGETMIENQESLADALAK